MELSALGCLGLWLRIQGFGTLGRLELRIWDERLRI